MIDGPAYPLPPMAGGAAQRFVSSDAQALLLSAASAGSAAVTDLVEAAREDDPSADLAVRETIEKLADALKMALEVGADHGAADYRSAKGQLHAAAARFLAGWA